jgi:hypothetical protein
VRLALALRRVQESQFLVADEAKVRLERELAVERVEV